LKSGAEVLKVLRESFAHKYQARDIYIDKLGNWHVDGVAMHQNDIPGKIDVAFNALHGNFGEDGKIQRYFEIHGVPYTGSDSVSSAIGMNRALTRKILKNHGLQLPYAVEISSADIMSDVNMVTTTLFKSFLMPAIVKPSSSGSSIGVNKVSYYDKLPQALLLAAEHSPSVLVEEFIPGIEATCGVIEGYRGAPLYTLPPVEIRHSSPFFDFEAKYGGKAQEIVPASFAPKTKRMVEALAADIHKILGLRHYSRSDFIIHPRRGIYVLETNTLPGLTSESLMPKSLHAIGSSIHEFVDHIIGKAML